MLNFGEKLDWKHVAQLTEHFERQYTGEVQFQIPLPLDQLVRRTGLDLNDPRLLQQLIYSTATVTDMISELKSFYGAAGGAHAEWISRYLMQAGATLMVRLRNYLPIGVLQGVQKTQRIQHTPIDTRAFKWKTVCPTDQQLAALTHSIKQSSLTPGEKAERDQIIAELQTNFFDETRAFATLLACSLILWIALPGLKKKLGSAQAEHMAAIIQLALYELMPDKIRLLCAGAR